MDIYAPSRRLKGRFLFLRHFLRNALQSPAFSKPDFPQKKSGSALAETLRKT